MPKRTQRKQSNQNTQRYSFSTPGGGLVGWAHHSGGLGEFDEQGYWGCTGCDAFGLRDSSQVASDHAIGCRARPRD